MAFRNTEYYIGEIVQFFQFSAKKQHLLDKAIDAVSPTVDAKKLKDTCKIRWIQHIDSYAVFLELLPATYTTLLAMVSPADFEQLGTDWNWDREAVMDSSINRHGVI